MIIAIHYSKQCSLLSSAATRDAANCGSKMLLLYYSEGILQSLPARVPKIVERWEMGDQLAFTIFLFLSLVLEWGHFFFYFPWNPSIQLNCPQIPLDYRLVQPDMKVSFHVCSVVMQCNVVMVRCNAVPWQTLLHLVCVCAYVYI